MNKFSVTHFIPLIGPWYMACDKLHKSKEFDINNKYIFSFNAFANNQQHLEANYNETINYLPNEILSDYDETDNWMDCSSFKKHIKDNNIESTDLMLAVPPCSGLSMLNTGNRGSDCNVNRWMYETVKWHIAQDNKVLCFENAPGLVGTEGVKVMRVIEKLLEYNNVKDKYKLHCTKTNTENHGIPQKRHRTFFYIYKSDSFFQFKNIKNVTPDLEDFLKRPEATDEDNHQEIRMEWASDMLQYIEDTNLWSEARATVTEPGVKTITKLLLEKYKNNPDDFKKYTKLKAMIEFKLEKLSRGLGYWDSAPCICKKRVNAIIAKNCYFYIHPKYDRYITVREMMDLMGYPNEFILQGDIKKNFNHICQSLPVNTGMDHIRWAQAIVNDDQKFILNKIDDNSIDVLLQDNMKSNLESDLKIISSNDKSFVPYKKNKKNKLANFIN